MRKMRAARDSAVVLLGRADQRDRAELIENGPNRAASSSGVAATGQSAQTAPSRSSAELAS